MKLMTHNQSQHKRKGFTLIELLIVIAIISILAAILFPVFARARENARRSSCQSNLKQIALSVMQYTQDCDERFPLIRTGAAVTPNGWAEAIQPYLKSTQLLKCPSSRSTDGVSDSPTASGYTHYAYNTRLGADDGGNLEPGKLIAILTQPTLTVLNIDDWPASARAHEWGCGIGTACTSTFPAGLAQIGDISTGRAANRHLNGANISFTDGHVKWYKAMAAGSFYLANVYNSKTSGTTSGNSPTFNPTP